MVEGAGIVVEANLFPYSPVEELSYERSKILD